MKNSSLYRKFAEECDRLAETAKDEQHWSILKEMAAHWRQLAKEDDA
jgi:hypothetical protein